MRHAPAAVLLLLLAAFPLRAGEVPQSITGIDLRVEHAARRAALAAALPPDSLAVIPAAPGDPWATTAVRQDEDYLWLTGVDEIEGVLLLAPPSAPGRPHEERLLLPPRNARREAWVGPRLYPGREAEEATGLRATGDGREAVAIVRARLAGVKRLFLPLTGPSGEHARRLFGEVVAEAKLETEDVRPLLGDLRRVKSPEEIARIRHCAAVSAEGHRRAMIATRPGMAEYEVQAVLEESCRAGGCRRQAYDSIVAGGPNSCILHYGRNRRILEEGDLLLVDAGGEFLGYACDISRTWPVGLRFTPEQAEAYDAVLAAQAAGVAAARPGATFETITKACRAVLEERGFGDGWAHGPCHWVGMNVHDPNGRAPLEPGVVFVVEPGVYYPEKGFGIRIEDTFVMREDGSLECLSDGVPRERKAVEALRAEGRKR